MTSVLGQDAEAALNLSVLNTLQSSVCATAAFCILGTRQSDDPAPIGWQIIDGRVEPLSGQHTEMLWAQRPDGAAQQRRLSLAEGHTRALLVSFAVGSLQVCLGVARRSNAPSFDFAEARRLDRCVGVVSQLITLHMERTESRRRELVLRAVGTITDACCAVDIRARRVVWVFDSDERQRSARDILAREQEFVSLVERSCQASAEQSESHCIAMVGNTTIARVADLGSPTVFDGSHTIAIALIYCEPGTKQLSARERQLAKLLASGFSMVNAATILSISENTIKTHVRRIYRKLDIRTRADLTRRCSALGLC